MMKKLGIVDNRAKKSGPTVRKAIRGAEQACSEKLVTCQCGAKLVKRCPNKYACDVSVMTCPRCGAKVS